VHSRIKAFGDYIFNNTHHGNYYINRDMIGATVGVNPFGGSLLSGTGPKAGGPNYLRAFSKKRLLNKHSLIQENSYLNKPMLDEQESNNIIDGLLETLDYWSKLSPSQRLETPLSMRMPKSQKNNIEYIKSNIDLPIKLSSPTGESNHLFYASRGIILFLLSPDMNESDVVKNIFLSLVCGCAIILISDKNLSDMCSKIIKDFDVFAKGQKLVIYLDYSQIKSLIQNKNILNIMMDDGLKISSYIREEFARRKYGILNVINPLDSSQEVTTDWLLGLVLERTKTENLVASGGNTQLFNLSDDSNVITV
jgi:RHH-type proline utilization regulon transcriptional repressor/proline dehydrogenase/delta 1-pyrroline-5-carboxylate dehydrogenase